MIDKTIFPDTKYFRFRPADYGTTTQVIKTLHYGKTITMGPEEVMIEYRNESDILHLFFRLKFHKPVPVITGGSEATSHCEEERRSNIITPLLILTFTLAKVAGICAVIYAIYLLVFCR